VQTGTEPESLAQPKSRCC